MGEMRWRDMESAPKDGTDVLIGHAGERWVCSGYLLHDRGDGYWLETGDVDDGSPGSGNYLYPTHWMPLPAPPTEPE